MTIYLNGQLLECAEGLSLADLVAQQAPAGRRVAVLHNGQAVPAAGREALRLAPKDRVELLTLAPGG